MDNGNLYYALLAQASLLNEATLDSFQGKDEYDKNDYSAIIDVFTQVQRNIIRMASIHKYSKMSKERFINKVNNNSANKNIITHTVKTYETISSIADLYGNDVDEILKMNNKRSFEINPGEKLLIEVENSTTDTINDIPTYADPIGSNVLGNDISKELADRDNDIYVLPNTETLKQGILNRITTNRNAYPMILSFGIDTKNTFELPDDLFESLTTIKIQELLLEDKRIKNIENISLDKQENSLTYNISGEAIDNTKIEI
jgi:hypothetical protein